MSAAPSEHAAALADSTTILTVVAVPSEHAAALTDSTRTLAVEAALLEDAAALVESEEGTHSGGSNKHNMQETC